MNSAALDTVLGSASALNPQTLINMVETRRLLGGVSRQTVERRIREDDTFPKPVQFAPGGPRYFVYGEVLEYRERFRLAS